MLVRNVEFPSRKQKKAPSRLIKYLRREPCLWLRLLAGEETRIAVRVDSNKAGEAGSGKRSMTGEVNFYGAEWTYRTTARQEFVSLSSTEADYGAHSETCKNIALLQLVINDVLYLSRSYSRLQRQLWYVQVGTQACRRGSSIAENASMWALNILNK